MATVADTKVRATVEKREDWGTGYDGCFVLKNDNAYDVLDWTLSFGAESAAPFTWFSDGDLTWAGGRATLVPKDWNRVIKAGTTLALGFGGSRDFPRDLRFEQKLPLVGPDPAEKTRGAWGDKVVAPYCDACAYPTPDLAACSAQSGLRYFTLAFVTADAAGRPSWGGVIPLSSQLMLGQVRAVRAAGGDVAVSFGGANGTELAQAITSVPALVAAYSAVVDMYSLTRADFDIEGGAVADAASVDRRNRALAALCRKYPKLRVTYCLPVLPTGLTPDGEALLRNARKHGVPVHGFHAMSMDYGDSAAPDPEGRMGAYAVQSARAVRAQALAAGFPDPRVGVIPMIGHNDVPSEFFRLTDAAAVRDFFRATPWMTYLGWWSTNRDRPGPGHGANPFDSGIDQRPWDFARVFLGGEVPAEPEPPARPPARPGREDARRVVTPALWDAIQLETRNRVVGHREAFEDVLADLQRRYRGLGPVRQRALRVLVGAK